MCAMSARIKNIYIYIYKQYPNVLFHFLNTTITFISDNASTSPKKKKKKKKNDDVYTKICINKTTQNYHSPKNNDRKKQNT